MSGSPYNTALWATQHRKPHPPDTCWKPAEIEYLRQHIGQRSLTDIAEHLGRSENAIMVKKCRLRLPAASKQPGYLTANQAAKVLGVDVKNITGLHQCGLIPLQRLPGKKGILRISIWALLAWVSDPYNFPYFRYCQDMSLRYLPDAQIRRAVEEAHKEWGDDWWSCGQAARYQDLTIRSINYYLHKGHFPSSIKYMNWYILRSEVKAFHPAWQRKRKKK